MEKFTCLLDRNEIIFELDGDIPSKKNNPRIFRRGKQNVRLPSTKYDKWHEVAGYQINLQKTSMKGIEFPLQKCEYIAVTIFYPNLRVHDNSNVIESIHDLLVDMGIISDDNWKVTGTTIQIPEFREKKPGARIAIKPKA